MIFTRHLITCGLAIEPERVSASEILIFMYRDGSIEIGKEPYSLVICPHSDLPENPWRIEGLRSTDKGDRNEIWYTGIMKDCIAEFERITQHLRDNEHQIIEPDGYDFETEIRGKHVPQRDFSETAMEFRGVTWIDFKLCQPRKTSTK